MFPIFLSGTFLPNDHLPQKVPYFSYLSFFDFKRPLFIRSKYFPCQLFSFFPRIFLFLRYISLQDVFLFRTRVIYPPSISCNDFLHQCYPLRISDIFFARIFTPSDICHFQNIQFSCLKPFFLPKDHLPQSVSYFSYRTFFDFERSSLPVPSISCVNYFPSSREFFSSLDLFPCKIFSFSNQSIFPNMNLTPSLCFLLHSTSCRVFSPSDNFTTRIYFIAGVFPIQSILSPQY